MVSDLEGEPQVMVSFGTNKNRLNLGNHFKEVGVYFCSGNWAFCVWPSGRMVIDYRPFLFFV